MDPLSALRDFRRARRRAALERLWARLQGRPAELLPFEAVQRYLRGYPLVFRGLQEIPLDAIVGSVGRYRDFTRHFFPLQKGDEDRWTRVLRLQQTGGLPPIEVYQVGQVYFVKDGHHRVSVARSMGAPTIEAYVTEVQAPVDLSPEDDPRTAILKAEEAHFRQVTRYDQILPGVSLRLTEPGQYEWLLRDIYEHAHRLEQSHGGPVPWEMVIRDWYVHVYRPVVESIRALGLMREFPQRTETDLYVWLLRHRDELARRLGWDVRPETTVRSLLHEERIGADVLERARRPLARSSQQALLFREILVALPPNPEAARRGVEQALVVARHEGADARLVLLMIRTSTQPVAEDSRETLETHLREAGVAYRFVEARSQDVAGTLCSFVRWADMLVVPLQHPPPSGPWWARWRSGFRRLVRRCPRPVLAVPRVTELRRVMVGYDGSPRAREALYCAVYWAARTQGALAVVYVAPEPNPVLEEARSYVQARGLQAVFIHRRGSEVAEALLDEAQTWGAQVLMVGGYKGRWFEPVLGSTVDALLRARALPVWIFP